MKYMGRVRLVEEAVSKTVGVKASRGSIPLLPANICTAGPGVAVP